MARGATRSTMATLKNVAERAGVSVITASRALNGGTSGLPVSPDLRQRVAAAASALGYRPHAHGRTLRDRRSRQVGALVINHEQSPLTNPSAYEYLLGINAGLADSGYLLTLVRLTDVIGATPEKVRALSERLLDGFIVVSRIPDTVRERLVPSDEAVIWLDNDHYADTSCLRRDEFQAGKSAAELLIRAGRRRVVWLQRPPVLRNHFSLLEREAGARAACTAAGIPFVEHDQEPGVSPVDPSPLLREVAVPGTGVLLATPAQARWAAVFFPEHGLRPGHDLGVAGCDSDGQIDLAWPNLSRVRHDRYGLGRTAAQMLLSLIEQGLAPSSQVLSGALHGGTTA